MTSRVIFLELSKYWMCKVCTRGSPREVTECHFLAGVMKMLRIISSTESLVSVIM